MVLFDTIANEINSFYVSQGEPSIPLVDTDGFPIWWALFMNNVNTELAVKKMTDLGFTPSKVNKITAFPNFTRFDSGAGAVKQRQIVTGNAELWKAQLGLGITVTELTFVQEVELFISITENPINKRESAKQILESLARNDITESQAIQLFNAIKFSDIVSKEDIELIADLPQEEVPFQPIEDLPVDPIIDEINNEEVVLNENINLEDEQSLDVTVELDEEIQTTDIIQDLAIDEPEIKETSGVVTDEESQDITDIAPPMLLIPVIIVSAILGGIYYLTRSKEQKEKIKQVPKKVIKEVVKVLPKKKEKTVKEIPKKIVKTSKHIPEKEEKTVKEIPKKD